MDCELFHLFRYFVVLGVLDRGKNYLPISLRGSTPIYGPL